MDETTRRHLAALDAYLDALRAMPNELGDAVRAIDHAQALGLPPLEQHLAGDLAQEAGTISQRDWVLSKLHLTAYPPLLDIPHADAPHRLAQAIANLQAAGLWPW
jgi:hypothetical protein